MTSRNENACNSCDEMTLDFSFNDVHCLQIFWALGTVFEVLLAILVMPTLGWRWLLGLSTIPLFIFAILCFVSVSVRRSSTIC